MRAEIIYSKIYYYQAVLPNPTFPHQVEFAPTNLHLQRMWVHNPNRQKEHFLDMTTVGAFTAYSLKYKHGGLRRLLGQFHEQIGSLLFPTL